MLQSTRNSFLYLSVTSDLEATMEALALGVTQASSQTTPCHLDASLGSLLSLSTPTGFVVRINVLHPVPLCFLQDC